MTKIRKFTVCSKCYEEMKPILNFEYKRIIQNEKVKCEFCMKTVYGFETVAEYEVK